MNEPAPRQAPQEPPDIRSLFRQWVYRNLGMPGLAALLIVSGAWYSWWNWETIKTRAGVAGAVDWISQKALPKCPPGFFCVAIAHLENDDRRDYEGLIVDALSPLEGVQVLRFDRTITLEGPRPQESVSAGHEKARRYLQKSGAQLLVWGKIQKREGKGVP